MFICTLKKAWYLVPRIEIIDSKAEIAYEKSRNMVSGAMGKEECKDQFH